MIPVTDCVGFPGSHLVTQFLDTNLFKCLNLKTSVEWDSECMDFYFRQGAMTRNNVLLQRIETQPELKSGVL